MRKIILSVIVPIIMLSGIIAISSCKKSNDVKALVRVLHDSLDIFTGDSTVRPVPQATVRLYSEEVGAEWLDTTVRTGIEGEANFVYHYPCILLVEVDYAGVAYDAGYIQLKEGEEVLKVVNIDEL